MLPTTSPASSATRHVPLHQTPTRPRSISPGYRDNFAPVLLPGGWADVNQTAGECVVREIAEESGFRARALKLAAVYDYQKRNPPPHIDSIYKMFFICDIVGGAACASDETSEVGFFPRNGLPPLSLGRTTPEQIDRMFQHRENPQMATDFD